MRCILQIVKLEQRMTVEDMIQRFQCPGCMLGSDITCGEYQIDIFSHGGAKCKSHALGTLIGFNNAIAIGMPKGFNKPGFNISEKDEFRCRGSMSIRLYDSDDIMTWDKYNVPVWALEQDGFLFVRTYCPRINTGYIDVVQGGTLALVPEAMDVSEFIDQMD